MVWSDGDPRIEVGAQDWVAAAKQHSMLLQEIRGTGPLVSGLMGMDMCAGCCQMEVHQRLTAQQTANRPFVLIFRKWSAEMEMISSLAPLMRHMPPGYVRGHGSHEWMMTTLPAALQEDWALKLIGGMIKYPFLRRGDLRRTCQQLEARLPGGAVGGSPLGDSDPRSDQRRAWDQGQSAVSGRKCRP